MSFGRRQAVEPSGGETPGTGTLSACCLDARTGRVIYQRDATRRLYPASTIKVGILIALGQAIDRGEVRLDDQVQIATSWTSVTGAAFTLHADDLDADMQARAGESITVGESAERMIVVSSNEASNCLIDLLGLAAINASIAATGARDTELRHYFGDRVAWGTDGANVSTAGDLARLVAAVAAATAANAETCEWMLEVLRRQRDVDLIPAALGRGVTVANKPGEADGVLHDVALVSGEGFSSYVVAICSRGFADVAAAGVAVRDEAVAIDRMVGRSGSSVFRKGSGGLGF